MKMKQADLIQFLTSPELIAEVRCLLAIKPFVNRGTPDFGWNCRDHALVISGLGQMLGHDSGICHGRAQFIMGPVGQANPIGIEVNPHSWSAINDVGCVDISPRIKEVESDSQWKKWAIDTFRFNVSKSGRPSRTSPAANYYIALTGNQDEYKHLVGSATHQEGTKNAIYLVESCPPLTRSEIQESTKYVNSPLTDQLKEWFGYRPDFHAKVISHLYDLSVGKGEPIAKLGQKVAWEKLLNQKGDAVYRVCSRGNL